MDEDHRAALEWQEWHSALCTGCGVHRTDSMNPDNQYAYTATPFRCFACQEREAKAHVWAKNSNGDGSDGGVYWAISHDDN